MQITKFHLRDFCSPSLFSRMSDISLSSCSLSDRNCFLQVPNLYSYRGKFCYLYNTIRTETLKVNRAVRGCQNHFKLFLLFISKTEYTHVHM
jgi:hypothetical protein